MASHWIAQLVTVPKASDRQPLLVVVRPTERDQVFMLLCTSKAGDRQPCLTACAPMEGKCHRTPPSWGPQPLLVVCPHTGRPKILKRRNAPQRWVTSNLRAPMDVNRRVLMLSCTPKAGDWQPLLVVLRPHGGWSTSGLKMSSCTLEVGDR